MACSFEPSFVKSECPSSGKGLAWSWTFVRFIWAKRCELIEGAGARLLSSDLALSAAAVFGSAPAEACLAIVERLAEIDTRGTEKRSPDKLTSRTGS